MNKNVFKSIGAIFAGFLVVVVLSIATDAILEATGVFGPPSQGLFTLWMILLAIAYRTIFTVAGGYVAAMLAPESTDAPRRHPRDTGHSHWHPCRNRDNTDKPVARLVSNRPCGARTPQFMVGWETVRATRPNRPPSGGDSIASQCGTQSVSSSGVTFSAHDQRTDRLLRLCDLAGR